MPYSKNSVTSYIFIQQCSTQSFVAEWYIPSLSLVSEVYVLSTDLTLMMALLKACWPAKRDGLIPPCGLAFFLLWLSFA